MSFLKTIYLIIYVLQGLCALYDDQIVVEAPCVPSTSRPANPEYSFEYIGNLQLEKLSHTFTVSSINLWTHVNRPFPF